MVALVGNVEGANQAAPGAAASATLKQYCVACHGAKSPQAGVSIENLLAKPSFADNFQHWQKVIAVLEQKRMPPEKMPQPDDAKRQAAIAWVRGELNAYAKTHEGDPGRVTVRRLTSAEYGYSIQDLTGLDVNVERDFVTDEVGGEGFTNYGDVQFMQDATMERYLEMAKRVADHAVIGAGPLEFFADAGKTGFELSAVARIREIYAKYGFRTVSGEGGRPYGLERYGKALFAAWKYKHRAALGEPNLKLEELARREEISPRFAQHIWTVMHRQDLSYPSAEVTARWHKIPAPGADAKASEAAARKGCEEVQVFLTTWPSWLFARGDLAAGGAGDERPLEFSDASLKVNAKHRFRFLRGGRGGFRGPALPTGGTARVYINAAIVNPNPKFKPVLIWRNPVIIFRAGFGRPGQAPGTQPNQPAAQPVPIPPPPAGATTTGDASGNTGGQVAAGGATFRRFGGQDNAPRIPLRTVLTGQSLKELNFGQSSDGATMGPDDFASNGSVSFEVKLPDGVSIFEFQADAEIGVDRDQVFRITMSDRADGSVRGVPVWGLVGDPQSAGYRAWKQAVFEYARILPPNSHGEPTPADKDPIPDPFDNTYNVPEHDEFVVKVKYIRDDRFVVESIVDEATKARLNHAWNDLLASFEYHDAYLRLLAKHYSYDLKGKTIADLDKAGIDALPPQLAKYVRPVRAEWESVMATQAAGRPGHLEDCLKFASRAWRRPLTEREKQSLRSFYDTTITAEKDHRKAVRALVARILVAPQFLYRVENSAAPQKTGVRVLSNWELASRLSYFLWSSIPDDELRRAAAANELATPQQIQKQVKRMLADPKARRMATEFFGQWLGFYRFDQHRGVDTARFPEFTDEVKSAMYNEAVSFFEHIVRKDRPVREILHADYTFLNTALAKHYGVKKEIKSKEEMELVQGADANHRGGLLRLGAVLTATSAPLRTSPVKRGDWVLRRVLGTPTPPPPADAGSIPADEKLFGGLSLREKLQAHQRNATCAACHSRIDPLGFPLERYDAVGRWRDQYADGKPVDDTTALRDRTEIAGVKGLVDYLDREQAQVMRTMANKMLGYALGRTVTLSDQPLVDRIAAAGGDASFSELAAHIATSKQFRYRRESAGALVAQVRPSGTDFSLSAK
jgi:mono/diheme cytochrome c family protein